MDVQLGLFDDEPKPSPGDATPAVAATVAPAAVDDGLVEVGRSLSEGLRLGTSSWSFPGWEGLVYDRRASEATLAGHGLKAYAQHPLLRTVGLDRTYYRPLSAETFRDYASVVPDGFRFLVKADRLLTSPVDPGDRSLRGPNPLFLDPVYAIEQVIAPMVEGLGQKAGPLLFQFSPLPPNLVGGRHAFAERLHAFLDALPPGPTYAVELRTPAFLTSEYTAVLESTGAAHGFVVHPAMSPLEEQLRVVRHFEQPALVLRWMLHASLGYEAAKDRYAPFDRLVDEDDDSVARITVATLDALIAERQAFIIVNNKAEGSAPLSVIRLARRLAGWTAGPPFRPTLASEPVPQPISDS